MKFRRRKPSELFDGAELPAPQDLARLMREKPEQASQKVLAHLQFLDQEHEKLQKNIKRLNSQHRLAVLVTLAILAIIISISFLVTLNKSEAIIFTLVIGALTGIFPASYIAYLFYRSRVQRERLKDDLRLLGLVTDEKISEINELYQTVYSPLQFVVYIILLTALSTLIFGAYYAVSTDSQAFSFIEAAVVKITFYGFLGAYFFGIQLVVRRYNTFDLQPQVYSSIILRTLLAVVVTFSAASIIENFSEFSSLSADSAAEGGPVAESGEAEGRVDEVQLVPWQVLAFIIGIFPSRGVRWLNFIVSRALSDPLDRYNERSLRKIIGINTWHEARLAELGIDNVQSLATADMCKLLLTTQFDTQQIINWIDQAILHMKVGSKVDRFTENQIITFHELQTALTRLPNPAPSRQLNGAAENSPREDAQANHRERLAASLGVMTADEVQRLSDYSNYPNYAYIQEYYAAIADIASEQASSGKQSILSTLGSQYSIGGSLLTNVHDLLGDNDVALESAEDVEAIEAEIEKLRTYLDLNPKKPQLFVEIGIRYYLTGQKDKALQAYNYAIELDGRLAEAYSNRSFIHIDQENYELAIFDTTKAIQINPFYAGAFNNLGLALMRQCDTNSALENFHKALELDHRLAVAYYNRGVAYNTLATGEAEFRCAVSDFEKAYLIGYESAGLWSSWGLALCSLGDYKAGIEKLSHAIILTNERSAQNYARRGYAYLQLGPAYYSKANLDFERAIQSDENLAYAYANYGLLKVRQGEVEKAISAYQKAIELGDEQYVTHSNLAAAHIRMQQWDQAIAHYETAIKLGDKQAVTRYNLGLAYYHRSKLEQAKIILESVKTFDKSGELAVKARELLQQINEAE